MRTMRSTIGGTALLLGCLALVTSCGGSSEGGDDGGTTSTTAATTTVTTPVPGPTVTSEPPATSIPPTTGAPSPSTSVPPTTVPGLVPGQPCAPGSSPDCIDPFGDGDFVYLIGGGSCMASPIGGGACADLDNDGRAGYPDRG